MPLLAAACLALALAPVATAAPAAAIPERPTFSSIDDGGEPRIALSPVRFEPQEAKPGRELRFPLRLRNTTDEAVYVSALAIPIEGSSDPDRYAEPAGPSSRGADAARWVSFPGFPDRLRLPPDTEVAFPASIRVPRGATPGTHAVGLAISQRVSAVGTDVAEAPSTRLRLALDLASVAVVRVPGDAVAAARLRGIDAPRFVWSGDDPAFRARVENVGDTDLTLDGQVELSSFLTSARRTLDAAGPEDGFPTLPGGTRELTMRWTDPPLLGWFEPELVVVGGKGSGVRITDELETVYVLPPWWLLLLVVLALLVPWRAHRRRRSPGNRATGRARARARVEERIRRDEARRRAAAARRRR